MAHSFLLCLCEPILHPPAAEPQAINIIKMVPDNKTIDLASEALDLLEEAIRNVDSKYVIELKQSATPKEREKMVKQVERCFAYELYHQLRLKFKDYEKSEKIEVNAEIPKCCSGKEASTKYPDLVIHGGQTNAKLQLLICEIKRNIGQPQSCENGIVKDLKKLGEYICNLQYENGPIGFDAGCFIMTNMSKSSLYRLVQEIVQNEELSIERDNDTIDLSEVADRITLFSYETPNDSTNHLVERIPLKDIYDKIKSC